MNELKTIKEEQIKNSDSIQNKINLLSIASQKKKILNQHLKALYKEYENLLCADLQTLNEYFIFHEIVILASRHFLSMVCLELH